MPSFLLSGLRFILQLLAGVGLAWSVDRLAPGKIPKPETPKTGQGIMIFVAFFAAAAVIWHIAGKLLKIPAKFR